MTAGFDMRFLVMHDPCMHSYRMPQGAIPAGGKLTLRLWANPDMSRAISSAWLALGTPRADSGGLSWEFETLNREGDTFQAQGGAHDWSGFRGVVHTPETPAALFYFFALELSDGSLACYVPQRDARTTAGELHALSSGTSLTELMTCADTLKQELIAILPPDGLAFQVTCYDPSFTTPSWLSGAVMYQLFPDRFARGTHGVRQAGLEAHRAKGRAVHLREEWDMPLGWNADTGYDPLAFYGGTLEGIREQLPYLASLGVEVLYLNPVFEARSYHRYDTADYEHVDPLLGNDDDLRLLAKEARELGIRIVLDAVLSHTGADSRYFNACGNYPAPGAAENETSPYRDWYDFAHPNGDSAPYRCWWGDPSLPEVDEHNPSWQRYILGNPQAWHEQRAEETASSQAQGEQAADEATDLHARYGQTDIANAGMPISPNDNGQGILGRWLAAGVSGYRLDVADELPDDVLEHIRRSVRAAKPDAALIGEVWEDATNKRSYGHWRSYALGQALDSVMNYPLRDALLAFAMGSIPAEDIADESADESAIDAWQLATFLKKQQANYPPPLYACLMNLMSSHDVERQRTALALGQPIRQLSRMRQAALAASITSEQDKRGAMLQRLLAGLLYALPGTPCLYYGDERGLQGGADPFCRAPFPGGGEADAGGTCGADAVRGAIGLGRSLDSDGTCGASGAARADQGRDLTRFYQELGQLRQGNETLRTGSMACLALNADALCISRVSETAPENATPGSGSTGEMPIENAPDDSPTNTTPNEGEMPLEIAAPFESEAPLILICVNRSAEPCDALIDLAATSPADPSSRRDGHFRLLWSSRDIDSLPMPENATGETPPRFPCENGLVRVRIPAASCVYFEHVPGHPASGRLPHPARR